MLSAVFSEGLDLRLELKPFTLVVYGASGDLSARKLFPALYTLFNEAYFEHFQIIGFARRPWSNAEFKDIVKTAVLGPQAQADKKLDSFLKSFSYVQAPFDSDEGYIALKNLIPQEHQLIHYLATAPEFFPLVADKLLSHGLSSKSRPHSSQVQTRIVVEKPFGHNGHEAEKLNKVFQASFYEKDIYRIDHYLGKESSQNLQVFRFGNRIFEPLWNNQHIQHVEITVAETVGVEGRGPYYDNSGALLDMVQNHLLQLLALVAMECPVRLNADAIHDEKVKVLRSLRPIAAKDMPTHTLRAQYRAGIVDSEKVRAYRQEDRVPPESQTETYAALVAYIDNWRWSGVPFLLRTGKRLSRRLSEIVIHFKAPPVSFFKTGLNTGNQLVFRIQSEEGITLFLDTKIPGLDRQTRTVSMDFLYGTGSLKAQAEAYERLILDAIVGDNTLFTRIDEVLASWDYIDAIKKGWQENLSPLSFYSSGSSGPEAAVELAKAHGASWRRI